MNTDEKISIHYRHGDLLTAIQAGLEKQGIKPENASVEDLGPVDEFHIGGRAASIHFLDQLKISPSQSILDIGCGLGGSARFAAKTYGAKMAGIDLTSEYVEVGQQLCGWVGLSDSIRLQQGSALSLPFEDASFDGAFMMHVGMNIEDKHALIAEVSRVLKSGAKFGIYDIMKGNEEELIYPVPWATTSETSWVSDPKDYRMAFEANGFVVVEENNRREFAMDFFKKMKASSGAAGGPPPLGLHVLMQQATAEKIPNMVANLAAGRISPIEMIAVKGI
ncbi:class I SAM-dependent methyltransferase [Sulfitobacter sp. SK011]|uniref:class I SAM-dependent methyltransferase n=1 Tax=Sulfitobacter sp. SK011 TaxID=1389004 RepID=UPI000E0CBB7D|nr:class I SAM-dependent methyltransferase [Sulfitobacter sp. SK011]AXI42614.1 SAM-dependent methyltransferase [Sulfitobacter sp. SK011]